MKHVFLALLCALSIHSLSAQFFIGTSVGVQKTTYSVSGELQKYSDITDEITRPSVGLVLGYNLSPTLSLQSEFNFVRSGFETETGFTTEILGAEILPGVRAFTKFNAVQVPLVAQAKLGKGPLQLMLEGGAFVDYIADAKLETKSRFISDVVVTPEELNINDPSLNRLNTGIVLGAGLSYTLDASSSLVFNVRTQNSLNKVIDDSDLGLGLTARSISGRLVYLYSF